MTKFFFVFDRYSLYFTTVLKKSPENCRDFCDSSELAAIDLTRMNVLYRWNVTAELF